MTDSEMQGPNGEKAEGREPRPQYEVVQSEAPKADYEFRTAGQVSPEGRLQTPVPPSDGASKRKGGKSMASPTRMYAAIGVGLGLLVVLVLVVYFLLPAGTDGTSDMGPFTADDYGLKGHLITKWDEKIEYKLTIEPGAPEQRAAFANAVSNSPRPLSFDIQLKDPFGAVLCSNTVLVKFDPRKATTGAASGAGPRNGKAGHANAAGNQVAQGVDLDRLELKEMDREHGNDIFQNDVGPDGQIASISAQGSIPCTKKQYFGSATWGFTADFPTADQQAELLNPGAGTSTNGVPPAGGDASGKSSDAAKPVVTKRNKREPLPAATSFYIEGDDAIVGYDASQGIVETNTGKAFLIDKIAGVASAIKGRDFPIAIHYRCDQMGACTFAGAGLGVQRARLRR